MSILLTYYSEPVLVLFLDYRTHKVHLLGFKKYFLYWTKILGGLFQLQNTISTFRLFINENSSRNANAM